MSALTDEQRVRCEMAMHTARCVRKAIAREQERAVSMIEQLIYGANEVETVDALVSLARHILEPRS